MTSFNDRFADLSIHRVSNRREAFTVNQIALGFINAVKRQAIEDCDQHITSYTFTDTEYADDPIRIQMNAAAGAPEGQLVRCNFLYAIKTLAIHLFTIRRPHGVDFAGYYRRQLLFIGVFDDKNDIPSLQRFSNSSAKPSDTFAQEKRALITHSLDATNSSSAFLTIPGSDNVEYRVAFQYRGERLSKISIFCVILEFMMVLAQLQNDDAIDNLSQATSADSAWIFVIHNSESNIPLMDFQLVAILESIARDSVGRGQYQELKFDFFVNREVVATGCVTVPNWLSGWCQGMREGGQQSLLGNFSSSSGSALT